MMTHAEMEALFNRLHYRQHAQWLAELRVRGDTKAYDEFFGRLSEINDEYMKLLLAEEVDAAKRAKAKAIADAEQAVTDFEAAKVAAAEYFNTPEFREDVIAELVDEGCTRLQAEGRTRDQARLFAEAARLNLM